MVILEIDPPYLVTLVVSRGWMRGYLARRFGGSCWIAVYLSVLQVNA